MPPSAKILMEESPMPADYEAACQEIGRLRAQLALTNARQAELFVKLEQQRRSHRAALEQTRREAAHGKEDKGEVQGPRATG